MLIANVAITIPANVFISIITSHEKFLFLRSVTIFRNIINPILVVLVLQYKAEALSVVKVQVGLNVLVIIANWWYATYRIKAKFYLHECNKVLIKSIFAFSFFIFLGAIVDRIYWKTGQLILGAVSGTTAVAIFSISILVITYYIQFSTAINGVFLPRLSRLAVKNEGMAEINLLFIKVGRLQFIVLGLVLTGFIIFGRAFLLLWINESILESYKLTLIMMIPLTLPLIQNLGILVLQAKNKHSFRSLVYIAIAILNVLISIPLSKKYGGVGCAIATGACLFMGNGLIINLYYKKIGIDIKSFFKEISEILPLVLSSLFVGWSIIQFVDIKGWIELILFGSLYLIIYFGILARFGFNEFEKELIASPLRECKKRCALWKSLLIKS